MVSKSLTANLLFKSLIQQMPQYIFWKDKNSVFVGCNDKLAELLGLNRAEDIVGLTDHDLNWQPGGVTVELLQQRDRKVLQGEILINLTQTLARPNGKKIIILTNKSPIYNNKGEIVGILGLAFDVTTEKKLEKKLLDTSLLNASKEKTEFIATLNNTLRSPISTIAMMVDMLRDTGLTSEQEQYLALLEEANSSMPDNLAYANDYAKIDSGDLTIYTYPLRLLYTIDALQDRYYAAAKAKGIDFIINYAQLETVWLHTSVTELKSALHTILDHCLQYTEQGEIRLSFQRKTNQQNKEIVIIIEDTSPGFDTEYIKSIFSEAGLSTEREKDYPLMSMRFAFCRKLIHALGGHLWAESQTDHGARFYLAFQEGTANPKEIQPDKKARETASLYRYAIIGEDHFKTQAFLSFFQPHTISRFSPNEAVQSIRQQLAETGELDMLFIEQSLAEQSLALIEAVAHELNPRYSLLVILCEHPPSRKLSHLLEDHRHLTTLAKPLKWMTIYRELMQLQSSLKNRSLAVLAVEDDPIAQKGLTFVLEKLGCDVTMVGTGEKALACLKPDETSDTYENFDVIILDIGLPGKSGLEIAQAIHKQYPQDCPPLIALTGFTRQIDVDALYESGLFVCVLEKPANAKDINNILSSIFEQRDEENS